MKLLKSRDQAQIDINAQRYQSILKSIGEAVWQCRGERSWREAYYGLKGAHSGTGTSGF